MRVSFTVAAKVVGEHGYTSFRSAYHAFPHHDLSTGAVRGVWQGCTKQGLQVRKHLGMGLFKRASPGVTRPGCSSWHPQALRTRQLEDCLPTPRRAASGAPRIFFGRLALVLFPVSSDEVLHRPWLKPSSVQNCFRSKSVLWHIRLSY